MNELQKIVEAYGEARARRLRMALATIVSVEGSAYRRPGARMLITEEGNSTGTISGGCLERDVLERVAQVFESHAALTVEYDTRGDEDIVWGLGLGCNGVVRVLLESLHEDGACARALEFAGGRLRARRYGVLATVVARGVKRSEGAGLEVEVGECLLFDENSNVAGGTLADDALAARVCEDAVDVLARGRSAIRVYEVKGVRAEIFYDVIAPPRPLVVFGAEQDALPLVRQAQAVGWHVTVVDTRARAATRERFAGADEVLLCRASDAAARVTLAENTAAVVMTHNYLDDVELLKSLLPAPVCYLGLLGPRARASKLLAEVSASEFGMAESLFERLHSPIGMDIGAETPEEIALSIVAEISAVCAARGGGFLRDRNAPIHEERAAETTPTAGAVTTLTADASAPRVSLGEGAAALVCHSS